MKLYRFVFFIGCMLIIALITSCSTQKDTITNRAFHNLTSHYNGYWNARHNMNGTIKEMQEGAIDIFYEIPPLVYYGDIKEAQDIKPSLDNSIEKSFNVIRKHSMLIKGRERVRWIDDLYMIIGKSYFYEQDYSNARRTFDYIIKAFPKKNIQYPAELWLARTYTQNGEFEKAQAIFEKLERKVEKFEVTRNVQKEFPIAIAEFYLEQKKFEEAKPYVETALKHNRGNKMLKQRGNYILGRIAEDNNNYKDASRYYKKASRGNNFYIAFNAKLRTLQSQSINNPKVNIVRKLNSMARENKNEEFRDQIYYALYEIYKRQGNEAKQIESLKKSVAYSVSNNYQKAISANVLADLYFDQKKYIESQPYYDTTIQFLPLDFPNYVEIKDKTHVLTDLVECLTTVQTEDSLQNLAKMSEADRMKIIKGIIADLKEQQRIEQSIEMQRQRGFATSMATQYENQRLAGRLGGNKGNWYFSNPQMISSGITEFKRRWGRRKLEDLWFLKDKQSFSWDELEDMVVDTTNMDTVQYITDVMDEKYYLQYLPLTDELMEESHKRIESSLYEAGFIAAERLDDLELSNECFSELVERYPETEHLLISYYMKYINCQELNDEQCQQQTKTYIINNFPDSDYAKIMKDPTYIVTLREKLDESMNLYNDVYLSYEDGMLDLVKLYSEEGIALNDPEYVPKFLYLSALADLGKQDDTASIVKLQAIKENYPGTEIATAAQDLLMILMPVEMVMDSATLAQMEAEKATKEYFEKEIAQYSYKCAATYFYVLVIDNTKANAKAAALRVSDFLRRYYRLENISTTERVLSDTLEMITVMPFDNCTKALDFYNKAILNNYIYSGMSPDSYNHFIISQENYPLFYRSKNIDAYMYFFNTRIMEENK